MASDQPLKKVRNQAKKRPKKRGVKAIASLPKNNPRRIEREQMLASVLDLHKKALSVRFIAAQLSISETKVGELLKEALERCAVARKAEDFVGMELERLDDISVKMLQGAVAGRLSHSAMYMNIQRRRLAIVGVDPEAPRRREGDDEQASLVVKVIGGLSLDSTQAPTPPAPVSALDQLKE